MFGAFISVAGRSSRTFGKHPLHKHLLPDMQWEKDAKCQKDGKTADCDQNVWEGRPETQPRGAMGMGTPT